MHSIEAKARVKLRRNGGVDSPDDVGSKEHEEARKATGAVAAQCVVQRPAHKEEMENRKENALPQGLSQHSALNHGMHTRLGG